MSPAAIYQPHDIYATIPYWLERRDGSVPLTNEDSLKIMRRLEEVDPRSMLIHDIRGTESEYTLDRNGFQVWNLAEEPKYSKDNAEIQASQYPIVIEEIQKLTQATHVKIMSHLLRDTLDLVPAAEKLNPAAYGAKRPRAPATRPHVDYHIASCPEFFSKSISSAWASHNASFTNTTNNHNNTAARISSIKEASEFRDRRWQILGVWRPLKTVQRHPLALVDTRSLRDADLVKVPRDYGDMKGAMSVLKPGEGQHRWCYLHGQRPDEAWVFKHYDSSKGEEPGKGKFARQCGHAALNLPGTMDLPMRESVEFRVLVLY